MKKAAKERRPWRRRPFLFGGIVLAILVIGVAGALLWRHLSHYESTDDAFVDVVSEFVSPQVPGQVLRVWVRDNQDVQSGQVLAEIDPADYQSRLVQSRAALAQAEAALAQARSQEAVARAQGEQARANAESAEANLSQARRDQDRYRGLRSDRPGAVSQQQWDRTSTAVETAQAAQRGAVAAVSATQAQQDAARAQVASAQAAIGSARAQIEQAQLSLSYTEVKARLDGRIANKTVAPGDYVSPGSSLMAVVPRGVYVTANFKETQIARMRPGQPVRIKIDSYPKLKIEGRVDSLEPATGQAFSLLPAENATGNWVKVVQRIPVKIVFDQLPDRPGERLSPGMSAEVRVQVR